MPYANKDKLQDYQKKWRKNNPSYQKEWLKARPKYMFGKSHNFLSRNPNYFKEYCLNNYKKLRDKQKITGQERARARVRYAIIKGTIKSLSKNIIKCSLCDDRATMYDHRDYNFPLDVTPVCRSCNLKLGKGISMVMK